MLSNYDFGKGIWILPSEGIYDRVFGLFGWFGEVLPKIWTFLSLLSECILSVKIYHFQTAEIC